MARSEGDDLSKGRCLHAPGAVYGWIGVERVSGSSTSGSSLIFKRERFHLAYRMIGRLFQFLVAGSGRAPRRQMAAAAACAIGDLAYTVALRRSDRFALIPRLAIDAVDCALWSQGDVGLDIATISGVPLGIEAGIGMGAAGLIVPVVNAAVTGLVRRSKGKPTSTGSFRYQVMVVALGAGIASYDAKCRRVALARHQQGLEARIGATQLAGQNEIATGADTVVDLLSRTTPLLASSNSPASVGRILADWRQSLATSTAEHATYLGIALARWQRRHNDSQHELVADVTFSITEGLGTILLSSEQATWLATALDGLAVRGTVTVKAVDINEARPPNRPRRLLIDGRMLTVPAELRPGLLPFDVGPWGFLTASLWFADSMAPSGCDCSPWAVGAVVSAGLPLALWAHRQVTRKGEAAHGRVLFVALAHSLIHAVTATGTMRNTRNPEGLQRFPFIDGLNMLAMLLPVYWDDLDMTQRITSVVFIGVIVATGITLFPEPIKWSHLALAALWPAAAFYSMSTVRTQLESDTSRLNAELEKEDLAVLANAYAEGRSYVLGLVSETRYSARRSFTAVRGQLDERICAEVERRLDEVDERLGELQCARES